MYNLMYSLSVVAGVGKGNKGPEKDIIIITASQNELLFLLGVLCAIVFIHGVKMRL